MVGQSRRPTGFVAPSFKEDILTTKNKRDTSLDTMKRLLNLITSYHIWRDRCNIKYSKDKTTPAIIVANGIWKEFKITLKARQQHIQDEEKWWLERVNAELVTIDTADQALEKLCMETKEVSW